MIKKIVSIGDSFLAGAEIVYPLPDNNFTAPALLAKKYNKQFINLALPGIGLQLAINILLDKIVDATIDSETLVVFCLPPIGRIDFIPKKISDSFKPTLDYSFFKAVEEGVFGKERLTEDFRGVAGIYNFLDDNIDFVQMGELLYLSSISLLKNLMSIYDFKIITFFGQKPLFINRPNYYHYVKLNFKDDIGFPEGFVTWAVENNFYIHEYGHPGKEAHKELSKLIETKFLEKYEKFF